MRSSTGTNEPRPLLPRRTRDKSRAELRADLRFAEARERALKQDNDTLKELLRKNARRDDELWFDSERNLWFAHNCLGERMTQQLPRSWRVTRTGDVFPSVHCERCGAHFFARFELRLTYTETKPFWSRGWV